MNHAFQPLIDAALEVRKNAYAPYSKFLVGAAALTEDGTIFTGTNVENASYGLTICAERIAVGSAVAAGHRMITAIAVATEAAASPCGACRQFLCEFGGDMKVLQVNADIPSHIIETSLDVLLPEQFDFEKK
jgi:cytidine deaminase